jgi:hypothetical protein
MGMWEEEGGEVREREVAMDDDWWEW